MKRYLFVTVILIISIILLSACSNPDGRLGPSWNITAKIPLIKGSLENTVTVEDLFGEDLKLDEGYTESLLSDNSNLYNIGEELTDVTFPEFSENVNISTGGGKLDLPLPERSFDDIPDGLRITEGIARIIVSSDNGAEINNMEIHINGMIIGFGDFNGNSIEEWDMAALELSGDLELRLSGEVITEGQLSIEIDYPAPEELILDVNLNDYFNDPDTSADSNRDINIDQMELPVIDEDLREKLGKLGLEPELFLSVSALKGMDINLSDPHPQFAVLDKVGEELGRLELEFVPDDEQSGSTRVFRAEASGLLNLILNSSAAELQMSGKYGISGKQVRITADSIVGIDSVEMKIPYELSVKDDLELYEIDPEKVDPIDSEMKDIIKGGSNGMLVIENLNNDFPIGVMIKIYAGQITEAQLSIEEIKEKLYQEANLFMKKTIEANRSYSKFLVELNSEDIDIFTKDNIYVGLQLIIPENSGEEVRFYSADELSFDNIYMTVTGQVNK